MLNYLKKIKNDFLVEKLNDEKQNELVNNMKKMLLELKTFLKYQAETIVFDNNLIFGTYVKITDNIKISHCEYNYGICINSMYFEIYLPSCCNTLKIYINDNILGSYAIDEDNILEDNFNLLYDKILINIDIIKLFLIECKKNESILESSYNIMKEKREIKETKFWKGIDKDCAIINKRINKELHEYINK